MGRFEGKTVIVTGLSFSFLQFIYYQFKDLLVVSVELQLFNLQKKELRSPSMDKARPSWMKQKGNFSLKESQNLEF